MKLGLHPRTKKGKKEKVKKIGGPGKRIPLRQFREKREIILSNIKNIVPGSCRDRTGDLTRVKGA